jgi:signal transduction histidine kinase
MAAEIDRHCAALLAAAETSADQRLSLEAIQRGTVEFVKTVNEHEAVIIQMQGGKGYDRPISHDLRSPLNSVIGYSEIMLRGLDGPLSDGQRSLLQAVKDTGDRLLNTINEFVRRARDQGEVG